MYLETIDHFARYATAKRDAVACTPLRFFVASMMAGAYVGLAITLIYSLGADLPPAFRHLAMGASFGVGLTLVVFAGGELFTGLHDRTEYAAGRRRVLPWLRDRRGVGEPGGALDLAVHAGAVDHPADRDAGAAGVDVRPQPVPVTVTGVDQSPRRYARREGRSADAPTSRRENKLAGNLRKLLIFAWHTDAVHQTIMA